MNKKISGRLSMFSSLARGYWFLLIASVAASILAIVFNYLTPQVFRFTVDTVLGDEPSALPSFLTAWLNPDRQDVTYGLIACAVAAMLCSVLSGIFNYICRYTMAVSSEGMIKKLRDRLFAHIQRLPYHWHVSHQTGDIIQRCTSDVEVVRGFLSAQLLEMLRTVFLIVLSLFLMFGMNVKLSLIALCFIPVVMAYSGIFYAKISSRFQTADEAEGDLSAAAPGKFHGCARGARFWA